MDPYNNNNTQMITPTSPPSNSNFYPASHYQQPQQHNKVPHLPLQNINMQQHQQPIYGSTSNFPPEYGLPTLPVGNNNSVTPPRRYISPQNSYGSIGGSPSSRGAIPPPYRPPPPAGRFASSPTGPNFPQGVPGISRRSSMTAVSGGLPYHRTHSVPSGGPGSYYSTSSTQNINALMDPSAPGMFQYHRSASGFVLNFFKKNELTYILLSLQIMDSFCMKYSDSLHHNKNCMLHVACICI
jgi:hypothetical protein